MPLAEKIRESIQRGEFIEQYCTTLQQITAANFEAGVNVLHTLQQELPVLQNQLQIRALLLYVHRFAIIFGVDKIKIWYQLIFNSIETKDHQLFKALETTVCEIFVKDVRLRDNFIDDYCQCKKITPNRQKILLTFAETKPKEFFLRVNDYLIPSSKSCFVVLDLLAKLAFRQRTDLRLVSQTSVIFTLLSILQSENDEKTVALCLIVFLMLIPFILNVLPSVLSKLFSIFKRLLLWKEVVLSSKNNETENEEVNDNEKSVSSNSEPQTPHSLRLLTLIFLHHLYALFPCNLFKFLKRECTCDDQFVRRVEPLLGTLRLNVMVFEGTADSELSPSRWGEYLQHLDLFVNTFQRQKVLNGDNTDFLFLILNTNTTTNINIQNEDINDTSTARHLNPHISYSTSEKISPNSKPKDVNSVNITNVQRDDKILLSSNDPMKSLQETFKQVSTNNNNNHISPAVNTNKQPPFTSSNTSLEKNTTLTTSASPTIQQHLYHDFFSLFLNNTILGMNYIDHLAEIYKLLSQSNSEPKSQNEERSTQFEEILNIISSDSSTDSDSSLQKLLNLQNLLEKRLSQLNSQDLWLGSNIQDHDEVNLIGTVKQTSSSDLQKYVMFLQNQLLFEKYLRQHYIRLLTKQYQTITKLEEMQLNTKALESKLESYKQTEIELRRQIQTQKQEIYNLKEQNTKVVTKFNNKLQTFAETIESLEEQLQTLKVKSESQQETIIALKVQVNQKDDQIFRLQTKIADLTTQLMEQGDPKVKSTLLSEQLILWELQQRQNEQNECNQFKLMAQLREKEKLINILNTQIEKLSHQLTHYRKELEENQDRLKRHEVEKDELMQRNLQLKSLLETQKNIAQAKLRAVEEKYHCIKDINSRLEKEILSLQTELEKYKHWIDTQASLLTNQTTNNTKS